MIKKNIIVLEGGHNEEHEISLQTSKAVKKILSKLSYVVQSIDVNPIDFESKIKNFKTDICFNALHGTFGEDGKIQKILYENKIKFSHSGVKSSNIAFNKLLTKKLLHKTQINYLKSVLINNSKLNEKILKYTLESIGPFVLKPVSSGSSYGVFLFKTQEYIKFVVNNVLLNKDLYKYHEQLMVEPFIEGRELTVAVMEEKGKSRAIEVTEIISDNLIFDYEAKYTKGLTKHVLPANIPKNIYNKCLEDATIVHDTLGCRGITRSDFLYDERNNKVFFLEINTQPGLTPLSLVPEQLNYKNIDFDTLIIKLLESSSCKS